MVGTLATTVCPTLITSVWATLLVCGGVGVVLTRSGWWCWPRSGWWCWPPCLLAASHLSQMYPLCPRQPATSALHTLDTVGAGLVVVGGYWCPSTFVVGETYVWVSLSVCSILAYMRPYQGCQRSLGNTTADIKKGVKKSSKTTNDQTDLKPWTITSDNISTIQLELASMWSDERVE